MIKGYGMLAAGAGAFAVALTLSTAGSALALSTKECSTKYQAAKDGGTLAGKSWNQFRKDECGTAAAPATTAPAATTTTTTPPATAPKKEAAVKPQTPPAPPKTTAASGTAVFPGALSAKFASETPSKQRFHTCLEQYNTNKTNNGNGGLKWIQKGGGYYSQCNAKLKS